MNLAAMPQPSAPSRARVMPAIAPVSLDAVLVVLLLVAGLPLLARALFPASGPAAQELQLLVGQGGQFRLDGRTLDRQQLDQALRQAQARSPDLRLQIATADASDNHGLVGALALAEHAGVRNIGSQMR